jgi:ribosome-associated heat shock protein Hsp15
LWHARFFKTRSLATRKVAEGLRLNGQRTDKPAATIRPGDVLTFVQAERVRVIEIVALAAKRGGAPEAQTLYRDLEPEGDTPPAPRAGARPTGRDRRAIDRLRRSAP